TDRCVTLAEVLHSAGYGTYACGKWHVNNPGPIARGFDEFYGFTHGYAVDSWDESMMIRLPHDRPQRHYKPGAYFATNAIADHALDFLDIARKKEEKPPWFLYVAFQAAHFPVQAPPELTAKYVETYRQGWDVIREQRLARMKTLGLIAEDIALPPREKIDVFDVARRHGSMTDDGNNPPWKSLEPARQADLAQRMAVYAAAVETLDTNVGRLVESLREHGELENTVIFFLSDNGACAEWDPYGFDLNPADYRNHPPGHGIDGGTPGKPNILHTGDELAKMGGPGSLFSYGCGWANASNTPLAYYKHYAHEGGIRTPFLAHWPGKIAQKGSIHDQPGHIFDIMATVVDLSGAKYPSKFAGHDILPMEGRSLLPALSGEKLPERTLVFEHEHNWAIRVGDWKLVSENGLGHDGLRPNSVSKLHNLRADPTEQHDVAEEHPDRVKHLTQTFLEEARRTLILPAP
ncbi:MAG TPA: sulfatase-like hydrolase/transferase, partial [Isosphaeraceae bacterium]|nr:sulfatase-like hydrolase/transferase [Isosphaeraceae bacterium]